MPSNSFNTKNTPFQPARPNKGRGRRPTASSSALSPAMKAEIERYVRRSVAKTEEVKVANYTTNNGLGSYNYTGFGSNQIVMLSPYGTRLNIGQGTGQADRIGDSISVKRAHLRLLLTVAPYNVTTNPLPQPLYVLWFIFAKKLNAVEGSSLGSFFQTGNSSSAPTGTAQDLLYDVNTDVYTVYKKGMVKLGYAAFVATPGGVPGSGYYSNNDSELSAVLDIEYGSYLKKNQEFTDTTNNSTTSAVEIAFWTVNQDGSATSTAVYQSNYWLNNNLYFTDS